MNSKLRLILTAVTASLSMWCGVVALIYEIDHPTIMLNGGGLHVLDWSPLIYGASGMTLLAVLPWYAAYVFGLRKAIFGFAVFVGAFLLLEAVTWYLGGNGIRVFGLTPEVAPLFEDDGAFVLLMVTNPLVSVLSGVIYSASIWLLLRSRRRADAAQSDPIPN